MNGIVALAFYGFLFLFVIGMFLPNLFSVVFKPPAIRLKIGLVFGGLAIACFVLFAVLDQGSKTTNVAKNVEQNAGEEVQEKSIVDLPSLLDKNWSELKPTLISLCGSEVVAAAERNGALNCVLEGKFNFYFEFDDHGVVTDKNEFIFIGHTQYGDTEASVLKAAMINKNDPSYRTSIKTDSTGQIIVKISR